MASSNEHLPANDALYKVRELVNLNEPLPTTTFFSLNELEAVKVALGFDLAELLTNYIEMYRDPGLEVKEKIAVGRQIVELIEKTQKYNGLLVRATETRENSEDGTTTRQSVQTNFVQSLAPHTPPGEGVSASRFIRPREEERPS